MYDTITNKNAMGTLFEFELFRFKVLINRAISIECSIGTCVQHQVHYYGLPCCRRWRRRPKNATKKFHHVVCARIQQTYGKLEIRVTFATSRVASRRTKCLNGKKKPIDLCEVMK